MPVPVTIPRLGWNMEEGTFIEWLKADGSSVCSGEALFRLEGDKATEEIESLDSGTLYIPANGPKPGERVAVGAVIGYLLNTDESAEEISPRSPDIMPVVKQIARESVHNECVNSRPNAAPAISPRARRLADRLGIDWSKVSGRGRTGRIRERDIAAMACTSAIPPSSLRRAIAARMLESRQGTAPVTLMSLIDATRLVAFRQSFLTLGKPEIVPTFTDLFVKLTASALEKNPMLAAQWTEAGIVPPTRIDIGIAVDTGSGLLVPVVRDVPALALGELASCTRDLIDRARRGTLSASEMQGGSFTITNLGSYGIDAFTPIINPPQCAVLGIGRITRQPVVEDDQVVVRDRVTLSLTFDHRIVDGGPAARFLQTLGSLLANTSELLQVAGSDAK